MKIQCGNKQKFTGFIDYHKDSIESHQQKGDINFHSTQCQTKIQLKYFRIIAYDHTYGVFNMASVSLL